MPILIWIAALVGFFFATNYVSYGVMKNRVLRRRKWDLNLCCGTTDGGGVNADVVQHADLPRFVLLDVYETPFRDGQFEHVLCSHTIEHVEDPDQLMAELERVGRHVTVVLPPLWDVSAALNVLEHRWLFWTLRKEHSRLPRRSRLPLARTVQKVLGQRMHA